MPDFKINPATGDLDLSGNKLATVTGIDLIAQRLDFLIHTMKGEWFYNKEKGLPYFQEILGKTSNKQLIDTIYIEALLNEDYVENVIVFESYIKDRTYHVSFTVSTEYGNLSK